MTLFPNDQDRIVPHAEGADRLRAIREHVEAMPDTPDLRESGAQLHRASNVQARLGEGASA